MKAWAVVGAAVAVAIVMAVISVWPHEHQLTIVQTAPDERRFQFVKLTQGTNHVIYAGPLAIMRRALYLAHMNPLVSLFPRTPPSGWSEKSSSTNTTVLWVGWTRTNYTYKMIGGIPHPDHMDCLAFQAFYGDTRLEQFHASEAPFTAQMVEAWELPAGATNGSQIRLVLWDQKEIGRITLQ